MATLAQNIQRAIDDFNTIENAIVQKGVPVPEGTPTSEYGEKILSIETGVDTSGDTVVPSALREGYTAHDAAGQEITGTIPDYSGGSPVEMTSPEGATLNTAGTYCEGNIEVVPKLQSKTATTGEIVTADAGYVGLSEVDTNPVFEAGKKSEYDAFWDSFQRNGERTSYYTAFRDWSSNLLYPKYNLNVSDAYGMFWSLRDAVDFEKRLEECGITFSTAESISFQYAFYNSAFTALPTIDTRSSNSLSSTFGYMESAKKIKKIILREDGSQKFEGLLFTGSRQIEDIIIEGTIGQGGLNLSWPPLSKASLTSIINALSTTTTGLTVTLRLAAVNTAFETTAGVADGSTSDEWTALIATKPNWTINLINS